jgi:hypothetical protein
VQTGPPAKAYRNASLTLATATWAKTALDTVAFDPEGAFAATASVYTCPTAGYYLCVAQLCVAQSSASYGLQVAVGHNGAFTGAISATDSISTTLEPQLTASDVIECGAGDTLEHWTWSSMSGISLAQGAGSGGPSNFLTVVRLA